MSAGSARGVVLGVLRGAHLVEVSVVMQGAYGAGAVVSAVRALGLADATAVSCSCGAPTRAARAAQVLAALPVLPAAS